MEAEQDHWSPNEPLREPAVVRNFINDLPKGTGIGHDAHVWPIYNEYAEKADKEMLETYNEGMDNLLIFAALFSAVVTAFIVVALPLLQSDPAQVSMQALLVISAQLAAQASQNGPPVAPYLPGDTAPSSTVTATNALWILSLLISLSTSVLAMLIKQWIRVYGANLPTTTKDKAMERQFRYDGLDKWKVASIANSLPVFIHIAVALFYAGLIAFLWLQSSLLWVAVSMLGVFGAGAYLALAAAPLIWHECPYKSPVTSWLAALVVEGKILVTFCSAWLSIAPCVKSIRRKLWPFQYTSLPVKPNELDLAVGALNWLSRNGQEQRVVKVLLSARFSWRAEVVLDKEHERLKMATQTVYANLPNMGEVLRPRQIQNLGKLPWSELKPLLESAFIACSSLGWSGSPLLDRDALDWTWSYPPGNVPEEELFWYHAVTRLIAKRLGVSLALPREARTYRGGLLPWGLWTASGKVSLSACVLSTAAGIPMEGEITSWTRLPRQETAVCAFLATSVGVPLEFLWAYRVYWVTHYGSLVQASGNSLSAVHDFFVPLIEEPYWPELNRVAMQMAVNILRSDAYEISFPLEILKSLLRSSREKLYVDLQLVASHEPLDTRLLRSQLFEMELLNECLEVLVFRPAISLEALLEVALMLDTRSSQSLLMRILLSREKDGLRNDSLSFNVIPQTTDRSVLLYYLSTPPFESKPLFAICSALLLDHRDHGLCEYRWEVEDYQMELLEAWATRICLSELLQEMIFEEMIFSLSSRYSGIYGWHHCPLVRLLHLAVQHVNLDLLITMETSGVIPCSVLWKEKRARFRETLGDRFHDPSGLVGIRELFERRIDSWSKRRAVLLAPPNTTLEQDDESSVSGVEVDLLSCLSSPSWQLNIESLRAWTKGALTRTILKYLKSETRGAHLEEGVLNGLEMGVWQAEENKRTDHARILEPVSTVHTTDSKNPEALGELRFSPERGQLSRSNGREETETVKFSEAGQSPEDIMVAALEKDNPWYAHCVLAVRNTPRWTATEEEDAAALSTQLEVALPLILEDILGRIRRTFESDEEEEFTLWGSEAEADLIVRPVVL